MEAMCCDCGRPLIVSTAFLKASAFLELAHCSDPPTKQPARCNECVERINAAQAAQEPHPL